MTDLARGRNQPRWPTGYAGIAGLAETLPLVRDGDSLVLGPTLVLDQPHSRWRCCQHTKTRRIGAIIDVLLLLMPGQQIRPMEDPFTIRTLKPRVSVT